MLGGEQVGPTTAKKHKPHKAPSSGMVLGAPQGRRNMVSLRDSLSPGTRLPQQQPFMLKSQREVGGLHTFRAARSLLPN